MIECGVLRHENERLDSAPGRLTQVGRTEELDHDWWSMSFRNEAGGPHGRVLVTGVDVIPARWSTDLLGRRLPEPRTASDELV